MNDSIKYTPLAIIRIEGSLLSHEDKVFESLIDRLVDSEINNIILAMSKVAFVDSSGIGLLMKVASRIEKNLGELVISNPTHNVANVFNMLGIDTRFKIFSCLDDAIENFGSFLKVEVIVLTYPNTNKLGKNF